MFYSDGGEPGRERSSAAPGTCSTSSRRGGEVAETREQGERLNVASGTQHSTDKPPRPAHPCRGLTHRTSPNSFNSCMLKLRWAPRWPLSAQGSASGRPCPSAPQHSDPTAHHPLAALTKDLRQ